MKHKKLFILLIMIMLLLFTGCAKVDIKTGVDSDCNAYLTYVIDVDLTSVSSDLLSTMNTLDDMMDHYQNELGFEVSKSNTDVTPGTYRYEMTKTIPGDNYEDAFNALQKMLTDESITPFMQVDLTSKMTAYQQLYYFTGELDFEAIYKTTNIESFPKDLQDSIRQSFEAGEGTVTIFLPGNEIEASTGGEASTDHGSASLKAPFSFNQKTSLSLSTRLSTDGDGAVNQTMESILQDFQISTYSWIVIGGLGFIAFIVGIALHLRKNKRKNNDHSI